MSEPTKEVQVDISFKGHNFTTFVVEEYMEDIFPIQELNLKITAVAGYQSGYISNIPKKFFQLSYLIFIIFTLLLHYFRYMVSTLLSICLFSL